MGSYTWGFQSPNLGYNEVTIGTLLITPLIPTHEPPSMGLCPQGFGFHAFSPGAACCAGEKPEELCSRAVGFKV